MEQSSLLAESRTNRKTQLSTTFAKVQDGIVRLRQIYLFKDDSHDRLLGKKGKSITSHDRHSYIQHGFDSYELLMRYPQSGVQLKQNSD